MQERCHTIIISNTFGIAIQVLGSEIIVIMLLGEKRKKYNAFISRESGDMRFLKWKVPNILIIFVKEDITGTLDNSDRTWKSWTFKPILVAMGDQNNQRLLRRKNLLNTFFHLGVESLTSIDFDYIFHSYFLHQT